MKTKLAAQTLSGSCSIALRFTREIGISGFEQTEATEEFLAIMNKLFDYMNSISKGKQNRAPLTWSRYEEVAAFFSFCKDYLLSLKRRHVVKGRIVDTPLILTARKTAVKGLIITMTSLQLIMTDVLADPGSDLIYLPTFKVSQDPLENFFSLLRSRFGFNNNPNVLQLQQGLKGIMCMKTKALSTGNCIEQETLSTKISPLASFSTIVDDNPTLYEENEDEEIDLPDLSLFSSNIVMYVSGFVAKKLLKKLQCPSCVLKLYATEEDIPKIFQDATLLVHRDRGGLFLSSAWLLSICKLAEQKIRALEGNGLQKMKKDAVVNAVLHECVERGLASSLDCGYSTNAVSLGGHNLSLIRQIVFLYSSTRFNHLARQATFKLKPTTNRNICTKSIHFSGN